MGSFGKIISAEIEIADEMCAKVALEEINKILSNNGTNSLTLDQILEDLKKALEQTVGKEKQITIYYKNQGGL